MNQWNEQFSGVHGWDGQASVRVHFGSARLSASEVERIEPGSVIELDALADDEVEIFVDGCLRARGRAVLVTSPENPNEHFAVAVREAAPAGGGVKRPRQRTGISKAMLAVAMAAAMLLGPATAMAQTASGATGVEGHSVNKGGTTNPSDLGYDSWTTFVQTVLALGVVIVLIYVLRWVLRRVGKVAPGGAATAEPGAVTIISRTPAGNRQQLLLVRLGGRLVLVGSWPGGMAGLSEITDPAEVAELSAPGSSARDVANKIRERLDGKEEKR